MKFENKIYVLCPAYYATGGTELLHQLVFKLRQLYGIESFIYYSDVDWKLDVPPTPSRFKKYINDNWVDSITDNKNDVLIAPETLAETAFNFPEIKKVLWWLSVDNFYKVYCHDFKGKTWKRKFKNFVKSKIKLPPFDRFYEIFYSSVFWMHLVQSKYAFDHLKEMKINSIVYLSDYINLEIIGITMKGESRINQVLYNPYKGMAFVKGLIEFDKKIKLIPIQNI